MTTFAPVREAYRLWLLTAPQLTLEVDDLTSLPVSTVPLAARGNPLTASVAPAATHNTNGTRRSTCPGSAAGASQETS